MAVDLDIASCRVRQQRLLAYLHKHEIDLAIVSRTEHVQWLAGPRFAWMFETAAALSADGRLLVVAPAKAPAWAAADEVVVYDAKWRSTLRNDQRQAASAALLKALEAWPRAKRIGVEFSCCSQHLTAHLGSELADIEPELYRLRRRKEADELAMLRKAIDGTGRMYKRAREIIRPGVNELTVFNELQAAAVLEYGEMLTATGNDYACAVHGGPPRDRIAQAGELYILDLGPAYRGYFSDNARTIAVDGRPTELQQRAWEQVIQVFDLVERTVRPGRNAQELFHEAAAILAEGNLGENKSHLGHGIGLYPHEAPHINPNWNDTFEVGEVIAVEPALYAEILNTGMRIENNYLVTESGVKLLSDFPLGL